jgi:tetratricopeptide (TPR) repeat protein
VYRETVRRFPDNVFARNGLGEVLKAAGKLDEAESVYRETVRRFPDNVPARNGLAGVLKALGKLEEAKSVYRDILDRFPKDVYAKKGLDSIDRLKPGSEEIDAPDFEWGFIPEFDGDLIPELDLEFVPELDDELTVQSGPPTDEPPQPQLEDSSQIRSLDVDRGSPEEPAPPALDLPASRPSGEGPAFLRPSDIDILIQDSHLLRKWARGTGELAMSHLREEARSLLGKLERFLRSSPSAVLESSLLLIETQNIQSALQLLDEAGARYPDSKRVQYASARTRREAARQARQEGHPFTFDSPSATDIPIAWTKLLRLEPVLLPTVRLGLVRSLPYLTDGLRLRKAQHSALGQLGFALHSLQPAKETKDPRSYWAYRVGELLLGDRAAEVRGASEVLDHDIDVASQNNEKHLLTLNGLEEDLLLHYHLL